MTYMPFPVIDVVETGKNITRLRKAHGFSVRDLQEYFGFEMPQAIYKWQNGQSLPTVDNLLALSFILQTPMDEIIVRRKNNYEQKTTGQSTSVGCPAGFIVVCIVFQEGSYSRSLSRFFLRLRGF